MDVPDWRPIDCEQTFQNWAATKGSFKSLLFYVVWELWGARNLMIFQDVSFDITRIHLNILGWMGISPCRYLISLISLFGGSHIKFLPAIYFDGAQKGGICGCGTWIKLSAMDRYHISGTMDMGQTIRLSSWHYGAGS